MTENEGITCMEMAEKRNESCFSYIAEPALEIAHKIPEFYKLIITIDDKVQTKIDAAKK